jgi:hypothetical protein
MATEVLAGKLEPVTATDEPGGPLIGDRVMTGVEEVTVKSASGFSLPPKVALILWGPTVAPIGMVIDLVNEPLEVAVALVWAEKSNKRSTNAPFGNPEPVTVTVVPGGPLVGDTVIVAAA